MNQPNKHIETSIAGKLFKVLPVLFLSIIMFIVLIVLFAVSSFGISLLASFANQQQGIKLESVSGSLFSQVEIKKLELDLKPIHLNAKDVKIDLGINSLFIGDARVDVFTIDSLLVILKKGDALPPKEAPSSPEYIELPLHFFLEQMQIKHVGVLAEQEDKTFVPLVSISDINLNAEFFNSLEVSSLAIGKIHAFQMANAEPTQHKTEPTDINLQIQSLLSAIYNFQYQPIALPEIFVPINAKLPDIFLRGACLIKDASPIAFDELSEVKQGMGNNGLVVDHSGSQCSENTNLAVNLVQQKLSLTLTSEPKDMALGLIDLHLNLDLQPAFKHDVSIDLYPNEQIASEQAKPLYAKLEGNALGSSFQLGSDKNDAFNTSILNIEFAVELSKNNLPLTLSLDANNFNTQLTQWTNFTPIPLTKLTLDIKGDTSKYSVQTNARLLKDNATDVALMATVSLSDKRFSVEKLTTSGAIGEFSANAKLEISPEQAHTPREPTQALQLDVQSNVKFTDLTLQALVDNVNTDLSGQADFKGVINASEKTFSLICNDIEGIIQDYNLTLGCDLALNKHGLLSIKKFDVKQANNSVFAKGELAIPIKLEEISNTASFNKTLENMSNSLEIAINLNDLSSMYSKLNGSIKGNASIEGQIFKPIVTTDLDIKDLNFETISLETGNLLISVDAPNNWQSNVNLVVEQVAANQIIVDTMTLNIDGDMDDHSIDFDLSSSQYNVKQVFKGQVIAENNEYRWQGNWLEGIVDLGVSQFELFSKSSASPTQLQLSSSTAAISSHCWVDVKLQNAANSNQGLCIDKLDYKNEQTKVEASVDYNLSHVALHFLPEYFYKGTVLPVNANININYSPNEGVTGLVQSLLANAVLITQDQRIDLTAIVANFVLADNALSTSLFAGTKKTGSVGVLSELSLDSDNREHKGLLSINNLILSPIQRFVPTIEKIDGVIQGRLEFDGLIDKPVLNGELSISDAELAVVNYPYPLKNFNQEITIVENKADIQGAFELGNGEGSYEANLDIRKGLAVDGKVKGNGLQLSVMEHNIVASPDLLFSLNPDNLKVSGQVNIPNADIKIESLPESARSPSSDVIILGDSQEPPAVPIGLDIEVQIVMDPAKLKRVKLSALDLDATLSGDLKVKVEQEKNIEENTYSPMQTLVYGSINTLSGSYEAYGQNLQIQKGTIFFSGVPNLPQFDITAIRNPLNTADNVVAGIRVSGNPIIPKVELFSEPTMIQARQLSYLLQGTDLDGGEGTSNNVMLVNALVSFGVGNSENGVNKLGQSLGFDSLNLRTAGQGENTQVQLTGRISDNIQLTYGVGLFDQASELILKYQLMPQLYIEATSGATSAVDLFYEITRGE